MTKTEATDATQVSTPVCRWRSLNPGGHLEFHFNDYRTLWIVPERIKKIITGEQVDIVSVQLNDLVGSTPRGYYGGKDIYGEKDVIHNEPLVRQYVEAAKSFVESEKPKNPRDRDELKISRRLINRALSFKS